MNVSVTVCNNKCTLIKMASVVERMGIPYVPTVSGVHCQTEGGGGGRLIIHEMEIEVH